MEIDGIKRGKAGITPLFKSIALKNPTKSTAQGRPIYDDVDVVEIRFAGSRDVYVFPATEFSHWEDDEEDGGGVRKVTYAERWSRQYQQFKSRTHQTKEGTPLDYLPFLTEGKRAELRALSIYTAEALAELEGQPLKNLGMGGRDLKNQAAEYLASSDHNATIMRMQQQIEALTAKLNVMQEEKEHLASPPQEEIRVLPPEPPDEEDQLADDEEDAEVSVNSGASEQFIGMTAAQLRTFITEQTGVRPAGNPSMKTLLRMAEGARG